MLPRLCICTCRQGKLPPPAENLPRACLHTTFSYRTKSRMRRYCTFFDASLGRLPLLLRPRVRSSQAPKPKQSFTYRENDARGGAYRGQEVRQLGQDAAALVRGRNVVQGHPRVARCAAGVLFPFKRLDELAYAVVPGQVFRVGHGRARLGLGADPTALISTRSAPSRRVLSYLCRYIYTYISK